MTLCGVCLGKKWLYDPVTLEEFDCWCCSGGPNPYIEIESEDLQHMTRQIADNIDQAIVDDILKEDKKMSDPEKAPYHIWVTRDPENTPPLNKPSHLEVVTRKAYDKLSAQVKELEDRIQDKEDKFNAPCAYALEKLWQDIMPEGYGDWEYPAQAYRHLKAEFDDKQKREEELEQYLHDYVDLGHDFSKRGTFITEKMVDTIVKLVTDTTKWPSNVLDLLWTILNILHIYPCKWCKGSGVLFEWGHGDEKQPCNACTGKKYMIGEPDGQADTGTD